MLEHLDSRLDALAQPVFAALYRSDAGASQAALSAAEAALSTIDGHDSERAAHSLYVRWLRLIREVRLAALDTGELRQKQLAAALNGALDYLAALAPASAAGQAMLARVGFIVGCIADQEGVKVFSPAVARRQLEQISLEDRDNATWSWLALWAFRHAAADELFEAYTEYLVRRKPQLTRFNWERMRLMYLLGTGAAIFRDVEAVIDKLPHIYQARQFGAQLMPACADCGIWDERLQMKYELRIIDLEDRELEPLPFSQPVFLLNWDGLELDPRRSAAAGATT